MTEFEKKIIEQNEKILSQLRDINKESIEKMETLKNEVAKELKEIRENTNLHYA